VTVIEAGPCVGHRDPHPETDGYNAVQIAFGAIDPRKVTKPMPVSSPRRASPRAAMLAEIRTEDATPSTRSARRSAPTSSKPVPVVDVTGTTKGKGFAGVMKRHGFHGVSASHGAQRNHR
jgi:large subunit ribosomal protein L3